VKTRALIAALALAGGAAFWFWADSSPDASAQGTAPDASGSRRAQQEGNSAAALGAQAVTNGGVAQSMLRQPNSQATLAQRAVWQQRYDRAEQALSVYRESTRYPPHARPIGEHPDQLRPFASVLEDKTLRQPGAEATQGVRLRTSQERVFLSGQESTVLTVSAVDNEGKPLPLGIQRALAYSLPDAKRAAQSIQAAISFDDAGGQADAQAGDGTFSARLQPASQGFAEFDGGIRVQLEVTVKGQSGQLAFDVVYASGVPATWASQNLVTEALEDGSLNFHLKANVRVAGRYVVSARVDDATGKPFALLTFNDEVAAGLQSFKLQLHGLLVRDLQPAFPLRLRDIDGFVLYADRFPDRAMMPRLAGVIHTSASYPSTAFTDKEWTSEERERYLAEYGRDLDQAREQLGRLKP
jgi:hypothetical protein